MARFEFRLKALLEVRAAERDAQRSQLAELLAAEERLRAHQATVAAELERALSAHGEAVARGHLDIDRLQAAQAFEQSLRNELLVLVRRQQDLDRLVSEQQELLVEAQRQVRVLEKLRDRQHQQYLAAQQSAQWRALDEAGARVPREAG